MTGGLRIGVLAAAVFLALGGCQALAPKSKPLPPTAAVALEPAAKPTPMPPIVLPKAPPAPPPPVKSCVPRSLSAPPRYPDTDAALRAAPGAADRYQLMAAGRILRSRRLEELEKVVSACR